MDVTAAVKELKRLVPRWLEPHKLDFGGMILRLKAFRRKNGHCNVPLKHGADQQLAYWIHRQRVNKRSGRLTPKEVAALDALGFDWIPSEMRFQETLRRLKAFRKQNGHCNVPYKYAADLKLAEWVRHRRLDRRKGRLAPDLVSALDALGFDWNPSETMYQEMLGRIKAFHGKKGHCHVSARYSADPKLANSISTLRQGWKKGQLSKRTISELNALGFLWNPYEVKSIEMLRRLKTFLRKHGHCNVPLRYTDSELATWVHSRRLAYRKRNISRALISQLNALSFEWEPRETKNHHMLHRLRAFKERHGHCNVPGKYAPDSQLAEWVTRKRSCKSNGRLAPDLVSALDALGFDWNPSETMYQEMLGRLKAFHKKHGHCNVPFYHRVDGKLAIWVSRQRSKKRHGALKPEQISELEALGFDWNPLQTKEREIKTKEREIIRRLKAYRERHGHCNVPQRYAADPKMAHWIARVRQAKKSGTLSKEWIAELDALGFDWHPAISQQVAS